MPIGFTIFFYFLQQTATWSAALLTASFMVLPQEHLHRLVFREWLDDDAVGIVKAFVNLAQAPTITKCLTFPSHNAANLAVVRFGSGRARMMRMAQF